MPVGIGSRRDQAQAWIRLIFKEKTRLSIHRGLEITFLVAQIDYPLLLQYLAELLFVP